MPEEGMTERMEPRERTAYVVMCVLMAMFAGGLGLIAHFIHGRSVAVSIVGPLAFAALLPAALLLLRPSIRSGNWRGMMPWSPLPVLVLTVMMGSMFTLSGFLALGEELGDSLAWGMWLAVVFMVSWAVGDWVRSRWS
jgi:hypothetical protein